jgi:hypothetical protein
LSGDPQGRMRSRIGFDVLASGDEQGTQASA